MPKNEFICDCGCIHEEAVRKATECMPCEDDVFDLVDFFKMLGDSTRCKLIFALFEGEMCVCDLANALSMTKSSISHQLSKMKQNGLVKNRREGKTVYYSLDDDHVSEIIKNSLSHIKHKRSEK